MAIAYTYARLAKYRNENNWITVVDTSHFLFACTAVFQEGPVSLLLMKMQKCGLKPQPHI